MAGKKDGFDSDSDTEKPVKSSAGGDGPKGKDTKVLPFLSENEVRKNLKSADALNEAPEELVRSLASYLVKYVNLYP